MTLSQNLAWPLQDGFFDVSWSLAVEEWFYLLASGAFLLSGHAMGRRGQWLAVGIFLVAPFLFRLAVPGELPWDSAIRKVVVLRLDAIAFGVAVAIWVAEGSTIVSGWRPFLALGIVLNLIVYVGNATAFGGMPILRAASFTLMDAGMALCLPAFLAICSSKGRIALAVRSVSDLSYGLYLIHTIILKFLQYHSWISLNNTVITVIFTGILTWILAWFSRRYFEQWILDKRPGQFDRRAIAVNA